MAFSRIFLAFIFLNSLFAFWSFSLEAKIVDALFWVSIVIFQTHLGLILVYTFIKALFCICVIEFAKAVRHL